MHEFALAEAVVVSALDEANKANLARITAIRLGIGELQRISTDLFEFALKEVMPAAEPRLAAAKITLEIERARFRCRVCERCFGLPEAGETSDDEGEAIHFIPELAHAFLRCPGCASPDFEVVEGRGVVIRSMEGERDDD